MKPQEFVNKWADSPLGEKQIAQAHFLDVCRLVGVEMPGGVGITQRGETFVFEQSLKQTSGHGFADVYYQNHFAIEYKSPDKYKDLNAAYEQLQRYRENLKNPPLLVVTDINHWEIHTNFANTEKRVYSFRHSEIASNPEVLDWLRHMFHAPERLHPGRNTEQVTKEAADAFQLIADNMRGWNAEPTRIAYFLTKLVFCLFAEDVGLLPTASSDSPQGIFTHIIQESRGRPGAFKQYVQNLFVAMNEGGEILMRDIPYFNGTLFNVVTVETLQVNALDELVNAAELNWASIEPSVFGTLFERSLDPDKRSQLGAHYTSREDILLIVEPVLMQPLRGEWAAVRSEAEPVRERYDKAQTGRAKTIAQNQLLKLRERILKRIRETTVLDPACGSGNFLYVSLQLLMDLEKEVIQHALWAGLQMAAREVHPRQMYGIEINPIAHALASIVVWIGYIQWRINNGYGQEFGDPILEVLEDNIVCKDAILPPLRPHPDPHPKSLPQNEGGTSVASSKLAHPSSPSLLVGEGAGGWGGTAVGEKWDISPELERRMQAVARELRRNPTSAEDKLWQAIRKQRLNGRKYRRQVAIGAFVVDFYCASERLAIEVDGPIHEEQQEADRIRQELIESLDIRFVRLTNAEVEHHLEDALNKIRSAFSPHPDPHPKSLPQNEGGTSVASSKLAQPSSPSLLVGEGAGGWGVEWPPVDVIVGNPPFLGDKKMRGEQGDDYVDRLREYYKDRLPGGTDFVTYWFEIARKQVADGQAKRVGLLATNSIRGGANREVLKRIAETGSIFMAWSDREWILDGAAVRVSMVGFDNGIEKHKALNGLSVSSINSDLTSSADITTSQPLRTNGNLAFIGSQKGGAFDIEAQFAKSLLDDRNESGVHNFDVVRPWMNGSDIVRMPRNMWIINFHTMSHEHASNYTAPMNYVEAFVKPKRLQNTDKSSKKYWWLHQRPRPEMRDAMADAGIVRFICTPRVAKHRVFVWLHIDVLPDSATVAIARDDNYFFGVLHSKLHEVWSLRMGTSLEDRPRYTPTTTFETFPFPWSPGREDTTHPAHAAISAAAANLHEERDAWLNPHPPVPSPIMREGELDTRELSTSDESPSLFMGEGFRVGEKALKDRTLTNLYNALSVFRGKDTMKTKAAAADFAPRLDQLHTALDQAVCDAYGWEVAILEDEEEILRRLLALNLERAEAS